MAEPSSPPQRASATFKRGSGQSDVDAGLAQLKIGEAPGSDGEYPPESSAAAATRIAALEAQLKEAMAAKESLETQHRGLLSKLTTMRNTLGDKLRQDADELDRREQQIHQLQSSNDDLLNSVETLKNELVLSNDETDQLRIEVDSLRSRVLDAQRQTADDLAEREGDVRLIQEELERTRLQREEWEREALKERTRREAAETKTLQLDSDLQAALASAEVMRSEKEKEAESAHNLHAVLAEFEAAKEREMQASLADLQDQLRVTSDSLNTYKQRASKAENDLLNARNEAERTAALELEVKEKNVLIGKLRHEGVILNEHLTDALHRLKRDASENSVDRRLVSNVLISFVTTPRADSKRFEMLQLLASILSWSDDDREKVGLQRVQAGGQSHAGDRSLHSHKRSKGHSRNTDNALTDDSANNETFSDLWVEFLLREATARSGPAPPAGSPTSPNAPSGAYARYPLPDFSKPSRDLSSAPALAKAPNGG